MAFGPWGIFLLGVIDSLGVPLPAAMDGLLLTVAVFDPKRAYYAALMAVLGSTVGNVALFLAARHGAKWLLNGEPTSARGQKFQRWFRRYGLLTVFIPAVTPIVPIPLKVFVVSAGALRNSFSRFLLVVVVARVIRYFGEAYLGLLLGHDAEGFLRRNAWSLAGLVLAVVLGLYAYMWLADRGRESAL